MSNFYLCDRCHRKIKDLGDGVLCAPEWPYTLKKVMVDHGSERGHMDPYDDPLDICPHFVLSEAE